MGPPDAAQANQADAAQARGRTSELIEALINDGAQAQAFDDRWRRVRDTAGPTTGDRVEDVAAEVGACLQLGDIACLATVLFTELLGRFASADDIASYEAAVREGTPIHTLVAWVAGSPEAQDRDPVLAERLMASSGHA